MSHKSNQNFRAISSQNALFYDGIANQYDLLMNDQDKNALTRLKVAGKFTQLVHSGNVMDFGGGTGLDLPWLTSQDYEIIFCEPSSGMRQKAIELNKMKLRSNRISFLSGQENDFTSWNQRNPFTKKLDGVLSNFAVLNNIPDLTTLFQAIAEIMKPGAHFIACIIDNHLLKILSNYPGQFLKLTISGKPITTTIHFKEYEQLVYIHTMHQIRKSSRPFFQLVNSESIDGTSFKLIHLMRK